MIFLLLAVVVCAIEFLARRMERQISDNTSVATISGTDHEIDKTGQLVRHCTVGVSIVFLLFAYFLSASAVIALVIVGLFAWLRRGLTLLEQTTADASRLARLSKALKDPNLSNAKLAMFFSAVDLPTPDHVNAWESEIDALDVPWLILTSEHHHFSALKAAGRNNAVFLPNLTSALQGLPGGLRAVLYANNAQKNRCVLRSLPNLQHVQILHGDSDKPPSYSPLTKNYDRVFVSGQMAIERYVRNGVHIPEDRFRIVGRPQVKAIVPADTKTATDDVLQIVYMPTWRGFYEDTQFSSLDRADKILEAVMALQQKVHVIFKPHPLSYKDPDWPLIEKRIDNILAERLTSWVTGEFSSPEHRPFDLYNRADILICDISSVMIDFLYANKPLITVLPHGFKSEDRANFPSLEACYNLSSDLQNLQSELSAAVGPDPLQGERARIRASAFGDLDKPPGAAFQAACEELIQD